MTLKELFRTKGIKQKKLAELLFISYSNLSYKIKHNSFSLNELQLMRANKMIDLQDLDNLTKDLI